MITGGMEQARDEVFALFNVAFNGVNWASLIGQSPDIAWQGQEKDSPPNTNKAWFRVTMLHSDGETIGPGSNRYTKTGLINVQSFAPLSGGKGLATAEQMAIMAEKVFQGQTSANGVWFRRVRSKEIGASGGWYQFNTLIDFEYDEMR